MFDALPLDRRRAAALSIGLALLLGGLFAGLRVLAYSWLEPGGGLIPFVPMAFLVGVVSYFLLRHETVVSGVLLALVLLVMMGPTSDEGLGNPVVGDTALTVFAIGFFAVLIAVELVARWVIGRLRGDSADDGADEPDGGDSDGPDGTSAAGSASERSDGADGGSADGADGGPTDDPSAGSSDDPSPDSPDDPSDEQSDHPSADPFDDLPDDPNGDPLADPLDDPSDDPFEDPSADPSDR